MQKAIASAGILPADIDLVNTHATGTKAGDIQECEALRKVFGGPGRFPYINNTKGFIGHAMGAAGTLELAGNLPSFADNLLHPCMNIDELDPECEMPNILLETVKPQAQVKYILNNSFGMLGINSVLIVKKFAD